MRIPLSLAVIAALTCAAPAAAQEAGAQSPPCRLADEPEPRDAAVYGQVAVLSDSIGMELKEAARAAGIDAPSGIVLVEVRNRATGEARAWSYRSNLPDQLATQVVARRAALLARMPDPETTLFVRLDPLPGIDESVRRCMPAVRNVEALRNGVYRIIRGIGPVPGGSPTRMSPQVRMLVTRDGEVAYAYLARRSARPDVDREVLELVRRLRFDPALSGTVRVDTWVVQPLVFEVREQPRRP
ncbi:MAG TPA: energy transducer TonB [Longimicrobium sp.]|nr:energy transducer TonB [Longimicrobium sp.]